MTLRALTGDRARRSAVAALRAAAVAVECSVPDAPPELSALTVYELKAVCRAKSLKVSGRKSELIARIREADAAAAAAAAGAPPAASAIASVATAVARSPAAASAEAAGPLAWGAAPLVAFITTEGTEVVGADELVRLELAERKAERRARLRSYLEEEAAKLDVDVRGGSTDQLAGTLFGQPYASQFAELKGAAGRPYALATGGSVAEVAIAGQAGASVRYAMPATGDAPMLLSAAGRAAGFRLAWCRRFSDGEGTIVDLESRAELAVARRSLDVANGADVVPEKGRALYCGEFVEYALDDARQVLRVQGVHGWPLMCVAAHMLAAHKR
jgi:hypothetical protein